MLQGKEIRMDYEVIIVGGGIAGLTAAAYLARAGKRTLLVEKQEKCGGLVNSFMHNGFIFDGGVRALENSGVLFPMLNDLGIELDLVRNEVSLGVEDHVIKIRSEGDIEKYQDFLISLYPESKQEINTIIVEIRKIMQYMEIQYGIDNPVFMDMMSDREYLTKEVLPWALKFLLTVPKINKVKGSVYEYLAQFTENQSLLDIISQHFFQDTPAFFALSYLKIYLDYYYPLGGTGKFIEELIKIIQENGGEIKTNTIIQKLNPESRQIWDQNHQEYTYDQLVWAADSKTLYEIIPLKELNTLKLKKEITRQKDRLKGLKGNDSILTLYLETNLPPQYFRDIATEHFFYTSDRVGQSKAGAIPQNSSRKGIEGWLEKFLPLTTYEISIPVLRDPTMAPEGKTGLIISILFDYQLTEQIQEQGWYQDFKNVCAERIIELLNSTIYPGIQEKTTHYFVSTPLTFARMFGNYQGAITGWSFKNKDIPSESKMLKIANAVKTSIPYVYQAGHWTYSPSGLPISLLTGKMASDVVLKKLRKVNRV